MNTTMPRTALLLMAALLFPAPVLAQGGTISGMVIEFQDGIEGDGVTASALINGIKHRIGTTGEDGRTRVDDDEVDIAVGTPVEVYSTGCNGARDLLLVPRGEQVPAEEDCPRPIGFFPWGEASTLSLGVGPTGWTLSTVDVPTLNVGLNVHGALFNNFEDQACAQPGIGDCSADELTTGFGGWAEYRLGARYPLVIGASVNYAKHDLSQTFNGGGQPITRTGSVSGLFVDSYVGWRLRPRPGLTLTPHLGPTWARDELSYDNGVGSPLDSRADSGLKFNGGVNLDYQVLPRLNVRLGYKLTHAFDRDDADLNHRVHVGAGTTFVP